MRLTGNRSLEFILIAFEICFLFTIAGHAQKPFSIIAFGDMPYNVPQDFEKFKRLIAAVNKYKPTFSVHVGDIKNGASDCSDNYYYQIKALFNQFERPLIYTPGDNEWTDCDRQSCGGYNPVERLEKLRTIFYDGNQSLGKKKLSTFNQNRLPGFEKYIENQYWEHNSISFGTFHAVGTNNNLRPPPYNNEEFLLRDSANLEWLDYIFDEAERKQQKGIILFTQASMNFRVTTSTGYTNIIAKLGERVAKFKKPVLLVYGDLHRFLVEKPLFDSSGKVLINFTSLMVFGETELHGVRINIDPKNETVFTFSEFIVNGN